jgi:hypothetical protein
VHHQSPDYKVMHRASLIQRTRAIISHDFFTPFFTAVYIQEWLILKTVYVVSMEILQQNPWFKIKSGFKSRVGYNGACTVEHRLRTHDA